jgi:hypothetical protein
MDYRGIVDYMSGNRAIVREADDGHLHNPNAEQEAQMEGGGTSMIDEPFSPDRGDELRSPETSSPELDF